MAKIFKNPTVIGLALICVLAIVAYMQLRNKNLLLRKCSIYTIGHINRIHTNRAILYVTYRYNLNGKTVEATESVNNSDTNEPWMVDTNELSKRRLLLQVYCHDIDVHKIVWDVTVPDTLQHIPTQGWKEIPFVILK